MVVDSRRQALLRIVVPVLCFGGLAIAGHRGREVGRRMAQDERAAIEIEMQVAAARDETGRAAAAEGNHARQLMFGGDVEGAINAYGVAIGSWMALDPAGEDPEVQSGLAVCHLGRGIARHRLGRLDVALEDIDRAVAIGEELVARNPGADRAGAVARALVQRARLHRDRAQLPEADRDLERAIALLGGARATGDAGDSVEIELAAVHANRSVVLRELGQFGSAVDVMERALAIRERLVEEKGLVELTPVVVGNLVALAWHYATNGEDALRDGERALAHARKACELGQWKEHAALQALAAAWAENGDFAKAIEIQERAIALAPAAEHEVLRRRLEELRAGRPLREPPAGGQ